MNHIYNTYTPLIEYNTTEEYRSHVRTIFKMDCESKRKEIQEIYGQGSSEAMNPTTNAIGDRRSPETFGDLDKESLDELLYDENQMSMVMDQIYQMTEQHPQFQELYRLAAAKMLSEDLTIGQAVICCYDYFYLFHPCMCTFIDCPIIFDEYCPYFIQLRDKLIGK